MTKPGSLPANFTTGQSFTAPAENNVETATNWLLGQYTSGGALNDPTIAGYTESNTPLGTVTTSCTLSITAATFLTATLTASTICVFTMPTPGVGKSFVLLLRQAASGGGAAIFTNVVWSSAGTPTVTTTGGMTDVFSFFSDGILWYGSYVQGFKSSYTAALHGYGVLKGVSSGIGNIAAALHGHGTVLGNIVAPLVYDNSAMSSYQNGLTSGTPFTWTQPATAGAYVLIAIVASSGTTMTPAGATPSVTFGGTTMSSLGNVLCDNLASQGWIWVFGLPNAPGGSSVTASVTLTQTGDTFQGFAASFTYLNVASVGSLVTAYGATGAGSITIPSATNNRIWAILGNGSGNAVTSLAGMTMRQQQATAADYAMFAAGDAAGAANVTVTGTMDGYYWAGAGLNMVAV